MAEKTDCPICRLEQIPGDVDRCPQCDSDLSCFRVLDALPEPEAQTTASTAPPTNPGEPWIAVKRSLFLLAVSVLLGVLVVVLLGLQIYRLNEFVSQASVRRSALNGAVGRIESRLDGIFKQQDRVLTAFDDFGKRVDSMERRISMQQDKVLTEVMVQIENIRDAIPREPKPADGIAIDPPDEPDAGRIKTASRRGGRTFKPREESAMGVKDDFEFYQALETDTLWGIAKRFYGFGFYYPVLLAHNPDLAIYEIGKKDRIAILKDAERVKQIYNEITENEGGRLYWYYTVRQGDTPASVRYKYCPLQDCLQPGTGFDSDAGLKPGKKIRIRLAGALK